MGKIVYMFTKTNWNEPPRIRHQITQMLISRGYKVYFFQKPSFSLKKRKSEKGNLKLFNMFELFHHQLRPFKLLIWMNKIATKWFIKKVVKGELKPDLIINYNYDYFFINEIFPKTEIVTVINDDFIDMAKVWMKDNAQYQLRKTCQNSNKVLALSYYLEKQLLEFTDNVEVFLPWAQYEYRTHHIDTIKDVVLWWGYIRYDIDWDAIEYIVKKNIKLRMIGPIVQKELVEKRLEILKRFDNFELLSSTDLINLDFSDVCCSLLCYRKDVVYDAATTISNRGFNLLSNGIPLVYANLPNLIEAPSNVIMRCDNNEDYLDAINYFKKNWKNTQIDIQSFLEFHYEESRYLQLLTYIKDN